MTILSIIILLSGTILTSLQFASAQTPVKNKSNASKCHPCQSSGGPETPQSKKYESTSTNFGQNSFGGPPQLSRDAPDNTLAQKAAQMAYDATGKNVVLPSWIQKNAKFYGNGSISFDDFVKGLNYLIKIGIIKVQ